MDINDVLKTLNENSSNLKDILNECKAGPAELVLLASKMEPILENLSEYQTNLTIMDSSDKVMTDSSFRPDSAKDV